MGEKAMKRIMKVAVSLVTITLILALFLSAGARDQGSRPSGGEGTLTVKQVTPKPLPVGPIYPVRDRVEDPQPATSYTTNSAYPAQPGVSNPNGFPITEQKINLRIAIPYYPYVTDYDNNDLTKYMESLTGVHIVWELLPESATPAVKEKINLMLSAGDNLPDVFLSCGFTSAELITYGTAKLFIPLQNLIDRHAHNMKRMYEARPQVRPSMVSADGNTYTLGNFTLNEPNQLSMRFWINKTFLDNLGMEMPTTTEEYYNYLVAVKNRDPNKNGRADEIPLVGAISGWQAVIDGFLMNSFIYNETSESADPHNRRRIFLTNDGKIDVSFNKPGWRQGIEYLARLCREGLLAPESFTLKKEDLRSLVENESALLVGSLPNGGPHEFASTMGERRTHYQVLPPLKGPNGIQQIWYDEYAGAAIGNYVITKDSKIPEVAVKWADSCYTEDFVMRNRYGVLERDWKMPAAGIESVDGKQAMYEEILRWGTPQNAYWGIGGVSWGRWGSYKRAKSSDPFELEYVLWNAYQEYLPYAYQMSVPRTLPFTLEESRRYNELNRLIVEYVEQFLAECVTGRKDVAREWDNYIATLNRMGLDELLRINQTAFDRGWKSALSHKFR
jgi:putative aldouronate transport system substrate-binding protein